MTDAGSSVVKRRALRRALGQFPTGNSRRPVANAHN